MRATKIRTIFVLLLVSVGGIVTLYFLLMTGGSDKAETRPSFRSVSESLSSSNLIDPLFVRVDKAKDGIDHSTLLFVHEARACTIKNPNTNDKVTSQEDINTFVTKCDPTRVFQIDDLNVGQHLTYIQDILLPRQRKASETVDCPRRPRPTSDSVPNTGLVSFPGSGNTWVRHLIQQITGIETGAIYFDKSLADEGFPGEGRQKKVIVVKSHESFYEYKPEREFDQQVVIIRNPFRSFLAEFQRGNLQLGHSKAGEIRPDDKLWLSACDEFIVKWTNFHNQVVSHAVPTLIVFYEDLKTCLLPELVRMAAFLRFKDLNQFSFCCALQKPIGSHYRNTKVNLDQIYPEVTKLRINSMLLTFYKEHRKKHQLLAERVLNYTINI